MLLRWSFFGDYGVSVDAEKTAKDAVEVKEEVKAKLEATR